MDARTRRRVAILCWLAPLLPCACQPLGETSLKISLPDENSRGLVREIRVFVVADEPALCDSWVEGKVAGLGDRRVVVQQTSFPYPVTAQRPPLLGKIPVGRYAFLIEGRGAGEEGYLRGCVAKAIPARGTARVEVALSWLCRPSPEICLNLLDDDCDGQVDEGCQSCQRDQDCVDGDPCSSDRCDLAIGLCIRFRIPIPGAEGPPGHPSCGDGLDNDCDGEIDLADPNCLNGQTASACDDGNPCTDDSSRDGICVNQPRVDGAPCDDGRFCSVGDGCVSGACQGSPRDCSAASAVCRVGLCGEEQKSCLSVAQADGTPCWQDRYCVLSAACRQGDCQGEARACADSDLCTAEGCDELSRSCTQVHVPLPGSQDLCGAGLRGDGIDQDCDGITDGCCLGTGQYEEMATLSLTAGSNPWYMVSGDFNGDTYPDLATVDLGTSKVTVVLSASTRADGRWDGHYESRSFDVGQNPYCLAAADLNADGILDLVTANQIGNSVSILRGQGSGAIGNGSFGNRLDLSLGSSAASPRGVVIADFNADAIPDLATANYSLDSVAVFLGVGHGGKGTGNFTGPTFFSVKVDGNARNPRALASADFNADGIIDLAVANWNEGKLSILLGGGRNGKGDGTFLAPSSFDAGIAQVAVDTGDFNADGIIDLAVVSMSSNQVSVLLGLGSNGRGNGAFAPRTVMGVGGSSSTSPVSVDIQDLGQDGIQDIVLAEWVTGQVTWFLGNGSDGRGDGTFQAPVSKELIPGQANLNPSAALVVDLDRDGLPDVAACNYGPDNVVMLRAQGSAGVGDGTFALFSTITLDAVPGPLVVADLSGDRLADLAIGHSGSGKLTLWKGKGQKARPDGSFQLAAEASSGALPVWIAARDVNGDRIQDLLVLRADGQAEVLRGLANGQGFQQGWKQQTGAAALSAIVADVTSDQIPDWVIAHETSLEIWIGNGANGCPDGTFIRGSEILLSDRVTGLNVGDLNADRIPDLVLLHGDLGKISVWTGEGTDGQATGRFSNPVSFNVGAGPGQVVAEDLNRDGILDLVVANQQEGSLSVLVGRGSAGQGDGTFAAATKLDVVDLPTSIAVEDINGDGIADLLVTHGTTGYLSVLLGLGNATFAAPRRQLLGGNPAGIAITDLDWDGRRDLVITDSQSPQVKMLRGGGTCTNPLVKNAGN